MRERGGQACVGVTTGQLLCACVGSRVRAEYTVYGDAINLSARLMVKAKSGLGEVLCDNTTHGLAQEAASFERLQPLMVISHSQRSGCEGSKLVICVARFLVRACANASRPQAQPGKDPAEEMTAH